jgi:hypothetical protein
VFGHVSDHEAAFLDSCDEFENYVTKKLLAIHPDGFVTGVLFKCWPCLDAVREVFSNAPKNHVDLLPSDVGMGPYDQSYRRQSGLDRMNFRYGGFGQVHLLLKSWQIGVPRVEKVGLPPLAN